MIIQRKPVEARNSLNFSQVKKNPALQAEQFQPLFKDQDDVTVSSTLGHLDKIRRNSEYNADEYRFTRNLQGAASVAGLAGGIWAAVAGHPLVASGAGLAALGMGVLSGMNHKQAQKHQLQFDLSDSAYKATEKAGDELANSLVTDGPGPDQITDRRYYTGGILSGVATVHSRESGALLRTQIELGGNVPRKLESNLAKGTVSVRSAQGDQTFSGQIDINEKGVSIRAAGQGSPSGGPIRQTIDAHGNSHLELFTKDHYSYNLSTDHAKAKEGFVSNTYSWENGQAACLSSRSGLAVANPIIPLHDLKPDQVRVLPDGVVGVSSQVSGAYQADEASLPSSQGIGTWSLESTPNFTTRLIEMSFGGDAFRVTSDLKLGTTRVTAADGSHVDSQASLIEINKTYRMQNQHVLGTMEQSLLPKEVLLTLQNGNRTLCVQHKSGQEPRAVEQEDKDFLEDVKSLPISLDANGTYWVKDGTQQIEMKPMMPLAFLEKEIPAQN